MRTYLKYLSRNKLYTFVTIFGFSVSMMFVIILGQYVRNELTVDKFHSKADRIFMIVSEEASNCSNLAPEVIQGLLPEIDSYCRISSVDFSVKTALGEKLGIHALLADSTFFPMFDFKLENGSPSEVLLSPKSVVITRKLSRQLYGEKNPVGQSITLGKVDYLVSGVMEEFPYNSLFKPVDVVGNYQLLHDMNGDNAFRWGNCSFTAFYLLKPGADVCGKENYLLDAFQKDERMWMYQQGFQKEVHFIPLRDCYYDARSQGGSMDANHNSKTKVRVLTLIVLLILVIAVLNYVNMTLAQAGFRGKEAAIRRLLGGSRSTVVRKLLVESLAMTSFTFLLGIVLAFVSETYFNQVLETTLNLRQIFTPIPFLLMMVFVFIISLFSGIIPAWVISRFKPIEVIKGTLRYKVKNIYSKILIVFQYTISLALLVCSFVIIRQTHYLIHADLGFRTRGVLWIHNQVDTVPQNLLRSELKKIPGVEMITFACGNPIQGLNNMSFSKNGVSVSSWEMVVDSAFFSFFEIEPTLLTNEPLDVLFDVERIRETEVIPECGNIGMINAVRPDPQTGIFTQGDEDNTRYRMVASIPNIKFKPLDMEQPPLQIRPLYPFTYPWYTLVRISDRTDKSMAHKAIGNTYKKVTGAEDVELQWADEIIRERYSSQTHLSQLIMAFACLTVLIMLMGVFAMSLYMIKQKEKEIAVRKVNGATDGSIMTMLNVRSLSLLGIAVLVAFPISWMVMNRWLQTFAYHITLSWWIFAVAAFIIMILSLISTSSQSWRASRANPVKYLKNE